jgi:hypothetical protein
MERQESVNRQRARYMNGELTHAEYYRWLAGMIAANPRRVIDIMTEARLLESTDEHFNDVPLFLWDRLHPIFDTAARHYTGIAWSLSDTVCTAKQLARDWLDAQRTEASCPPTANS